MRRLAAALITTTLLLAGCAGEDEPQPAESAAAEDGATAAPEDATATPEDVAALEAVEVEGELGSAPELTFDQPFTVSAPVARVTSEGTGPALEEGQKISMHYVAVSGEDGSALGSTWDEGQPQSLTLGDPTVLPVLSEVLTGQNVGARILFARPGTEAVEATDAAPAQPATPATVLAIEVVDARTVPDRAEGEAVAPPEGLPVVTLAENGEPEITIPADATEPTELVAQTLIKGDGPVVEAGQQITVHYKGALWDGTVFDTSWGKDPFTTVIGGGQVIPGWDQGLVGQTVGSQVLLVIPSELGYGPQGSGESIPPDSTLVFVVDILDAA